MPNAATAPRSPWPSRLAWATLALVLVTVGGVALGACGLSWFGIWPILDFCPAAASADPRRAVLDQEQARERSLEDRWNRLRLALAEAPSCAPERAGRAALPPDQVAERPPERVIPGIAAVPAGPGVEGAPGTVIPPGIAAAPDQPGPAVAPATTPPETSAPETVAPETSAPETMAPEGPEAAAPQPDQTPPEQAAPDHPEAPVPEAPRAEPDHPEPLTPEPPQAAANQPDRPMPEPPRPDLTPQETPEAPRPGRRPETADQTPDQTPADQPPATTTPTERTPAGQTPPGTANRPVPERAWRDRDVSFLQGCWRLISDYRITRRDTGEVFATRNWQMCFDGQGGGTQTMVFDNGLRCQGPVQATFAPGGNLAITDTGDVPCSNGSTIDRRITECRRLPSGTADCTTQHTRPPQYPLPVRFQRQR